MTVSDGDLSDTDTVTITVEADNDAPTAEAGTNQTVDEGDLVTLSGSGTDPENDTLSYSWRQTSGKTVTLSSTGVAAPTFTAPNLGANEDLVFELTVSDGDLSGTDTVTITIEADNDAPTAEAGDNKTVAGEAAVALSGSGTDPENDTLSYSWRQTGGSPSVSLTGSTTQTPLVHRPKSQHGADVHVDGQRRGLERQRYGHHHRPRRQHRPHRRSRPQADGGRRNLGHPQRQRHSPSAEAPDLLVGVSSAAPMSR